MDIRRNGFSWRYNGDEAAANYFDSLPLQVKEEINRRPEDIRSISDMEHLAACLDEKLES